MEVKVKLFGDLREGRFEEEKTQLEGNSRVIDIINKHNLPLEKVAICMVLSSNLIFSSKIHRNTLGGKNKPAKKIIMPDIDAGKIC